MPRGGAPGFRDEASSNEVNRWIELQASLGKNSARHANVLRAVGVPVAPPPPAPRGATEKRPRADDHDENADPSAAPDPTASRLGKKAKVAAAAPSPDPPAASAIVLTAPGPYRIPPRTVLPPTSACEIARASLGVDPRTGAPNRVEYGGVGGLRSSNADAYDAAHDPANAAVLAPAIANARPSKVRSQTHSVYAETIRGSKEDRAHWARHNLRSTKQTADAPVARAAASVPGIAEDKAKQRANFMSAVVGSKLYYGDMLNDAGAAEVEAKLRDATPEEADEILSAFREMHAGTSLLRQRSTSTARAHFRQGYNPTALDRARRKEVNERVKALVTRPESDAAKAARETNKAKARAARAATKARLAASAMRRAEEAEAREKTRGVCCDPAKKVPGGGHPQPTIKFGWDFKSSQPPVSSYQERECANVPAVVAAAKARGRGEGDPVKREPAVTAPYGPVNWLDRPQDEPRRAYPVPRYLTRRTRAESRGGFDPATTQRTAFRARPRAEALEEAKKQSATKAANRLRRSESQIPIGKKGLMDHDRHRTTTTVRETYKDPEGGAKPSGAAGG